MLVVLTGAYRNVGDHLIGQRAIALLKEFVDSEVINLTRSNIQPADYAVMNKARAVILCGGPAYQKEIYPKIYPIDYKQITVPIIPMGLGWKSDLGTSPETFKFADGAQEFINHIHKDIEDSSVRDDLTCKVIKAQNINNVLMTGCPAWYDLKYIDKEFSYNDSVEQIAVSLPATYHSQIPKLLKFLKERYPDSKKVITYHHGYWLKLSLGGMKAFSCYMAMMLAGLIYGFKPVDLSKDTKKLEIYDVKNSLHIGYRVHAHLYCLSHKIPSFLINEDVRGKGQADTLNLQSFDCHDQNISKALSKALDEYHQSKGQNLQLGFKKIKETFPVMKKFLSSIG